MADRDNPVVPFAAGVAVGVVLTALGFYLFSGSGCRKETHQVGASVKCTCKKGKDECKMHCIRGDHKCS